MTKDWQFFVLGFGVAMVQGSSQALSRSLIGRLLPKSKSAEFYGFFSVVEKFNTIIGPALVALSKSLTGTGRWGILSLVFFFLVGIAMLQRVNIERGMARAAEEDAKMVVIES